MPRSDGVSMGRIVAGFGLLALLLLVLALVPVFAGVPERGVAPATADYQLLANPGMEIYDAPYGGFQGIDCQVASGWERFWYGGPEPFWLDTRVFADSHLGAGWVEKIEGSTSQLLIATEPYTAGIWQRVTGLTPGRGYGFHAAMLTIYQTSAPPAVDGTMIKQVGIDPTGGTDPQAPTVVWSAPDDHDEGPWDVHQRTAVYAQAPAMTVFIRVISPYESGGLPYLNYSFLDSAILAQTPVVSATSPAVSDEQTFAVNWDNAVPAPGGGKLKGRDVQWLDEAEGVWHDWFNETYQVQASFVGERGHTYRFRARAWQEYPNGAHLCGPFQPEGDTSTWIRGPMLAGRVLSDEGRPAGGATVAISGTTHATTTGSGGWFGLKLEPWPEPQTITVSHPGWASPAPVYGVLFGPTETVILTWTLRSPDDAVVNGEFESGLDGWSPIGAEGFTPTVVTEPVHTGHRALALGASDKGSALQDLAMGVTQTVALTGAWEPVLSFWYRPETPGSDSVFNTILTVVTPELGSSSPVTTSHVLTPDLSVAGWRHLWHYPYLPEAVLTGTVTIRFQVRPAEGDGGAVTTVYLDEVSLGATPGGPFEVYLPLAIRRR